MTLKQLLDLLEKITKEDPKTLDMKVVSASDDEGNNYTPLIYAPSVGYFENGVFLNITDLKNLGKEETEINAVCIN